jgi:hypothetical protein
MMRNDYDKEQSLLGNVMNVPSFDEFDLPDEDREKLKFLACPVPDNEVRRIGILQQTRLLDSSPIESSFDRFTHLASLIFCVSMTHFSCVWFQ